jgi:hypothetical protein
VDLGRRTGIAAGNGRMSMLAVIKADMGPRKRLALSGKRPSMGWVASFVNSQRMAASGLNLSFYVKHTFDPTLCYFVTLLKSTVVVRQPPNQRLGKNNKELNPCLRARACKTHF